jgi:hypothetical protein
MKGQGEEKIRSLGARLSPTWYRKGAKLRRAAAPRKAASQALRRAIPVLPGKQSVLPHDENGENPHQKDSLGGGYPRPEETEGLLVGSVHEI